MPNPEGINNFDRFAPEPAYGEKTQQQALDRAAPTPKNPALNAPRRAQKASQRPQRSAPQAVPQMPAPQLSQSFLASQVWGEIAAIPGASDLVKAYAAKAAQSG